MLAQHAGHAPQDAAAKAPVAAPDNSPKAPHAAEHKSSMAAPSAFDGYRPYNPQEPAKGWRASNEEVRAAGGHVGMMKGAHGAGHREDGKK